MTHFKQMVVMAAFLGGAALPAQTVSAQAAAPKPAPQATTRSAVIQSADATFARLDANKDGSVTKAEMDAAQARLQQQAAANASKRAQDEFNRLDKDNNGQLSLAEFTAARGAPRPADQLSATAIQRLDTSKDGKVSAAEYRASMVAAFDRADVNKDGTLTPQERQQARRGSPPRQQR